LHKLIFINLQKAVNKGVIYYIKYKSFYSFRLLYMRMALGVYNNYGMVMIYSRLISFQFSTVKGITKINGRSTDILYLF